MTDNTLKHNPERQDNTTVYTKVQVTIKVHFSTGNAAQNVSIRNLYLLAHLQDTGLLLNDSRTLCRGTLVYTV
jgi:hypothetical protein